MQHCGAKAIPTKVARSMMHSLLLWQLLKPHQPVPASAGHHGRELHGWCAVLSYLVLQSCFVALCQGQLASSSTVTKLKVPLLLAKTGWFAGEQGVALCVRKAPGTTAVESNFVAYQLASTPSELLWVPECGMFGMSQ